MGLAGRLTPKDNPLEAGYHTRTISGAGFLNRPSAGFLDRRSQTRRAVDPPPELLIVM